MDRWLPVVGLFYAAMVAWGFHIGEAPSKGGWIKKSENPKTFKFAMAVNILIVAMLAFVSFDMALRQHLPQ